jgi:hypothetical protein
MKIPAIRNLVENYTLIQLQEAENALIEGAEISIMVEGNDEGEQLTHIIAAAWILEQMKAKEQDFKEALRAYTQKVRESIS